MTTSSLSPRAADVAFGLILTAGLLLSERDPSPDLVPVATLTSTSGATGVHASQP